MKKGWHEVDVQTLQELFLAEGSGSRSAVDRIAILLDKDPSEILKLHPREIKALALELSWSTQVPQADPQEWNGFKLQDFNDLTLGEWIDLEGYVKKLGSSMHKVLGVLYRRGETKYDWKESLQRAAELRKMPAPVGYTAIQRFSEHRNGLYKQFKSIFESDDLETGEEQLRDLTPAQRLQRERALEIDRRNREATNWFYVVDTLASGDPLKYEAATDLNVNFAFKYLEFRKIKSRNGG